MIAYGEVDIMIAGGSEALNTALTVAGFAALRALSTQNESPASASKPFDQERDGFVLGEGACALVLESYDGRGCSIYAEVTGFGMTGDASYDTQVMEPFAQCNLLLQITWYYHINAHARQHHWVMRWSCCHRACIQR